MDPTEQQRIERLVAVETNLQNLTLAVNNSAKETKETLKELNVKLDAALPTFVTKEEFNTELSAIKRRTVIQNTLSAILGSILTLLISFFFYTISK